jgi:DNA helicase II / ATP-dependent DNA helicase PcrA
MQTLKKYLDKQDKGSYLELLSSISTFVQSIRDYKLKSPNISIEDIIEYYDLMKQNNFKLNNVLKIQNSDNPYVELLTVHKAKGMEFDSVFVINTDKESWAGRGGSNKVGVPINLKILPDKDDYDDFIRQFYVAATRAKKELYFTKHLINSKGKETEPLPFFSEELLKYEDYKVDTEVLEHKNNFKNKQDLTPVTATEKQFFLPILEKYKMSVTHLNNFLDVTKGGPRHFFETNLVRFPQSKIDSGGYGSAMHLAIAKLYSSMKEFKRRDGFNLDDFDFDNILKVFTENLISQRLSKTNFEFYLKKGLFNLRRYFDLNKDTLNTDALIEVDFGGEDVLVGKARISGKIDKLEINKDGSISVTDFKTGRPKTSWKGEVDEKKVTLDRYQRQLGFYKLLIENSRRYKGFHQVTNGKLEFLEDAEDSGNVLLNLELTGDEKIEKLNKLINIVWNKIMNLDFPDVSDYPKDIKGIYMFIDDLLENRI